MKQRNNPTENEITEAEETVDSGISAESLQKRLLFIITIFVSAIAAYLYGKSMTEIVEIVILSACGAGMIIFSIEKSRGLKLFLYDFDKNLWQFMLMYCIFLVLALLCPLLPFTGWPYLAVFTGLMLFSNEVTGLTAGSSLLLISMLLQEDPSAVVYFTYFLGGLAGILLFSTIDESLQIWIPLLISLLVQFVCLCVSGILMGEEFFSTSMLLVPTANTMVCLILLLIILKFFSLNFNYQTRNVYINVIDPEYHLLVELRNKFPKEYYHTVHTSYLCNRIAKALQLDESAVKACAYYHRIGVLEGENNWENTELILQKNQFPPQIRELLNQYLNPKAKLISKEVVVLLFADTMISTVEYYFSQNKEAPLDYSKLIQTIFKNQMESGVLNQSEITLGDLEKMKAILLNERLYYDFIR